MDEHDSFYIDPEEMQKRIDEIHDGWTEEQWLEHKPPHEPSEFSQMRDIPLIDSKIDGYFTQQLFYEDRSNEIDMLCDCAYGQILPVNEPLLSRYDIWKMTGKVRRIKTLTEVERVQKNSNRPRT